MKLSYVIVTRNRREALLQTLARLEADTGLGRHEWEVFVVDNASEDDSIDAVTSQFPQTRIISLSENEGVPARNHAVAPAGGKYLAFLDDDSYPLPGAIPAALAYLSRRPKTAALVARVILPNGEAEAPAMPAITIGGASIIRRSVMEQIGGFDPSFIRQAEEYDLSCRIWQAGYRIERFEDICFGHDKVPGGRSSELTRRMDLRNNLIVVERYLPRAMRSAYRRDWLERYTLLGLHEGFDDAMKETVREVRLHAREEARRGRRTIDASALEAIFEWDSQAKRVAQWSKSAGIKRVAIADVGKNIFATHRACRLGGLHIASVLENHPAFAGRKYRGIPIVPHASADESSFDGIVLSNINPAQVEKRSHALEERFKVPILKLWTPRLLSQIQSPRRRPELNGPGSAKAA